MKRICLIVLLLVLASSCLFSAIYFDVGVAEDEWGDEVGDPYLMILTDDFKFTNSYSYNELGDRFYLFVYPDLHIVCGAAVQYSWSDSISTFYLDDVILVKYRDAEKNVTEVGTKPSYNEAATFTLINKEADAFLKTMKSTNKFQLIVKGTNYEKSTQYNATFEYNPETLASYLEQIGWKF